MLTAGQLQIIVQLFEGSTTGYDSLRAIENVMIIETQQGARWITMRNYYRFFLVLLFSWPLAGCQQQTTSKLTSVTLTAPDQAPDWVRATGYAPISLQPGETAEHKQLNAMRVSKLRAYQELAAIINGQYLYGTTTIESMVLQNDGFKSAVAGIVRGARVVKSYPIQEDTYATILEVDLNNVEQAWISTD